MNNDLISREALKKALNEMFDTVEVLLFDDIITTIDNAPTVERPTGKWLEWKDERWGGVWYYCSNCRVNALYTSVDGILKQILSDFCPYCGAKMKGDKI